MEAVVPVLLCVLSVVSEIRKAMEEIDEAKALLLRMGTTRVVVMRMKLRGQRKLRNEVRTE